MRAPRSARPALTVLVITVGHGLMEFICGQSLFGGATVSSSLLLLYTACAFLLPLGIGFAGRWVDSVVLGMGGAAVVAVGALIGGASPLGAAVLGIGNAAFHVAGGTMALRMRRPATAVGIFVSSGAIGLALGKVGGPHVLGNPFLLAGLGAVVVTILMLAKDPGPRRREQTGAMPWLAWGIGGAVVLGLTRTLLITATPMDWKTGTWLVLAAALASAVGKASGGVIGDAVGWLPTAIVAIVGASVIDVTAGGTAIGGLLGIALINMTVPLTIAAIAERLPGSEGLAFGIGQAIQFTSVLSVGQPWSPAVIVAASALCLAAAFAAFARPRTVPR